MLFNHSMLSFMISCKKSDLLSNSFVFSLIALNAKAINSFDEKNEDERADERTKERENAYELRREAKMMMRERTYEMMMMMREERDQADKKERSKKKSKNEWEREKKKKRFNCDSFVMMRRFKNEMRSFIFENLRRMFFVSRLNTTMFSLIFINFSTRFEVWYCECCWENVSSNDERRRENHCWWLMKEVERTEVVIEIKWALMRESVLKVLREDVLRILRESVLRVLTKILTTILRAILKARILRVQNSLTYTSFFLSRFNLELFRR